MASLHDDGTGNPWSHVTSCLGHALGHQRETGLCDPGFELLGWHRTCEQESLAFVAAHVDEVPPSALVFDPFGEHGEAELVAQADDGLRDGAVLHPTRQFAD